MEFDSFTEIFEFLIDNPKSHINGSVEYLAADDAIKKYVSNTDLNKTVNNIDFWHFGQINFGYFSMGAINSLDLFGIDELIIFSIYKRMQKYVKNSLDFGANIGLHSLAMGRMGWHVRAFEPDQKHFTKLELNLSENGVANLINPIKKAVWVHDRGVEFTRVLGNTTGNHINGMKSPYGDLEQIFVETVIFEEEIKNVDFIKLDVEGAEGELFRSISNFEGMSDSLSIILEISENSRKPIFDFAKKAGLQLFCQKLGWEPATDINELPISHKDGSVLCAKERLF
jgi:FkbM family methyltransferase